jgi:protein-L-isoaspartate(D-aspartate) O-methyltransferase
VDIDVSGAFTAVPREWFLPEGERRRASYDGPIPIGHDQTNSQPRTVEAMLRLLDVRRGQRVLDVGSGSGWTTALLAHLVGPEGAVLGLELEPDLVELGRAGLATGAWPWARIEPARDGVLGDPEGAPYDRVLVSAMADEMPATLVAQLADDGRMVVPVAGEMVLVAMVAGSPRVSRHGHYRFVPLR